MFNDRFYGLGKSRSVIRELFEYGRKRKAEIGEDKVFDFSLGNPSIAPPESVKNTILSLLDNSNPTELHGYTQAQGDLSVRSAIAKHIEKEFSVEADPNLIYLTCGAAASLTITLSAILSGGEKVVTFAPYFPEYDVFTQTAGGALLKVTPNDDMTIDLTAFDKMIDESVAAVIINSPNNPSGVVYPEQQIIGIAEILDKKQKKYGKPIFLISDEPYRELTYGAAVPYITKYYKNTIVCYSYSKAISLPGERIGYIFVSPKAEKAQELYLAICGAGRALGYVCAPSLFQKVIKNCVSDVSDINAYRKNRDVLCAALKEYGYEFAQPDGAFYLFVKAPSGDGEEFSKRALKHELLIVDGTGFGVKTHARISYCVSLKQIENSLPAFKALMDEYKKADL